MTGGVDNIQKFYESDSMIYDARWEKPGGAATSRHQKEIVAKLLNLWTDKKILEVGCGSGRFSELLCEVSPHVLYLDLTHGMLRVTRRKILSRSKGFLGVMASAYNIPLASSSRDVVISINVFNHIEKPAKVLSEINRILRPGGKLLLNFTNLYSYFFPMALFINGCHKSIGRDVYSVWSKPKQTIQLLQDSGFSIDEVVGNVFVPLNLDKPFIRHLLIFLDRLSRKSSLKWLAPTLFIASTKR